MKCRRVEISLLDPERLANLIAKYPNSCWLDSALQGHPHSRFSLFVFRPLSVATIKTQDELLPRLRELDRWLAEVNPEFEAGMPFAGGVVGFLKYPDRSQGSELPAAFFLLVDSGILIDHRFGTAAVFSLGLGEDLRSQDSALATRRCEELQELLKEELPSPAPLQVRRLIAPLSRGDYLRHVREIQERIARGDCYQVNFSQRFRAEGIWDPADFYLRLRRASPAPQMAFLNLGQEQILSASPETLLEVRNGIAHSFPIKGTRPRGKDPESDRRLAEELRCSPKDAAELLMIVDLVRNDLGRCCRIGSIRVPQLKALDSLPQVHHLYAAVEGRLKDGVGALEALWTLSPGGSITGAPKLKAMEIISEFEAEPRGIYTGSIGYAGFGGRASFNIAIRSAHLSGNFLEYSAGGGIVADSDPESEYEECLHKSQGFFQALGVDPDLA